ncbi:Dolichyl-phosphate-mannose-protein mannosyltransferase [Frankia sp. AiPs1]
MVAALCVFSFAASLLLQATLLRQGSGDADEAAYVLQARMLLHGQLTLDAARMEPFFRPWLTGEHDGRLFTKYLPGWPALLAGSQALFGTMAVAPAAVAAGWVAGTYLLAREVLDDAASAVLAAAVIAASPLVLLHTALPLAYACGAATLTTTAAVLLRGARTGSRPLLLAGGAGSGFAMLLRPYDALLVLAVAAVFALARLRRTPALAARRVGWVLLGAAPFAVLLLAFNTAVTGSPLRMPLSASDPLDRFGFGPRRILPSEPTFAFGRRLALHATVETLDAAPGWLFGGPLLVACGVVGALARPRRTHRLLLVAMAGTVVTGYLFWWGTAFARPGLRDGLGPHYHLAAVAPVVVLGADGARRLWSAAGSALHRLAPSGQDVRRQAGGHQAARVAHAGLTLVAVTAAFGFTLSPLPAKLRGQDWVNDHDALLAALLPDALPGPSVVVVTPDTPSRYTQVPYQILRNDPELHDRVLYAADLGPVTATLGERMPGRALYRLRPAEIVDPAAPTSYVGSFTALHQVQGRELRLDVELPRTGSALPASTGTADSNGSAATSALGLTGPAGSSAGPHGAVPAVYVRVGSTVRGVAVDADHGLGPVLSVVLTSKSAPGSTSGSEPGAGGEIPVADDLPGEVVVGLAVPGPDGTARWEERIPIARRAGTGELTMLTPGLGWRVVPSRPHDGWLPARVAQVFTVTTTSLATGQQAGRAAGAADGGFVGRFDLP